MESNESIELGVIFNYMANRYVEWRTTVCEAEEKEKKKRKEKRISIAYQAWYCEQWF